MNEFDGERDQPVVVAPRKAWTAPTIEVVPMDDTEGTFMGHGADGSEQYS
jgi:hypothetical protein